MTHKAGRRAHSPAMVMRYQLWAVLLRELRWSFTPNAKETKALWMLIPAKRVQKFSKLVCERSGRLQMIREPQRRTSTVNQAGVIKARIQGKTLDVPGLQSRCTQGRHGTG